MEDRASFIFKNKKGNCYCFAAAFYYVARQLGYDACRGLGDPCGNPSVPLRA